MVYKVFCLIMYNCSLFLCCGK